MTKMQLNNVQFSVFPSCTFETDIEQRLNFFTVFET